MTSAAPTYEFLEQLAKRRVPRFAFDFVQGGTGADRGLVLNRQAFDAIEIVPRFGLMPAVDMSARLFGRDYAMPLGIAPVGLDAMIWPGATMALARASAAANIPYIVGTLANSSIEEVAAVAGANTWLQLYGFPRQEHRVTLDLMARARAAGVSCIVATMDAPVRAKRPRDLHNRLAVPFRPTLRAVLDVATSPAWAFALLRHGSPKFANLARYVEGAPTLVNVAGFVQRELRGTFTWEELALLRRNWDGQLLAKGILHPDDALEAVKAGVDGIIVSNHGGRQSDAAPSPIDVLPVIRDSVGDKVSLMLDSGVRSGLDAVRALAMGAEAVFCGRAFLYALAALGDDGGLHVARLLSDELRVALAQSGAMTVKNVRQATYRHVRQPGGYEERS